MTKVIGLSVLLTACGSCEVRTEHFEIGTDVPSERLDLSVPPTAQDILVAFDLDTGRMVVSFQADSEAIDWLHDQSADGPAPRRPETPEFRDQVGWSADLPAVWDEPHLTESGFRVATAGGVLWAWKEDLRVFGYRD